MNNVFSWIKPIWPAPNSILAGTTLAISNNTTNNQDQIFGYFNLADHVNDHPENVSANRNTFRQNIASTLNTAEEELEFCWLNQTHSNKAVIFDSMLEKPEADAIISLSSMEVCAVLTADCLPVLLCSHDGKTIAAIHAGWRGLASGVINNTVEAINQKSVPSKKLYAWLGPAIGPGSFEVGEEVLDRFTQSTAYLGPDTSRIAGCFNRKENGTAHDGKNKYLADIYQLATLALRHAGLHHIYGSGFCTHSDKRFYSYRRSQQTGRMATFIVRP